MDEDEEGDNIEERDQIACSRPHLKRPCNLLLLDETPLGSRCPERRAPKTHLPLAHATPDFNGQGDRILPENHQGQRSLRDVQAQSARAQHRLRGRP